VLQMGHVEDLLWIIISVTIIKIKLVNEAVEALVNQFYLVFIVIIFVSS